MQTPAVKAISGGHGLGDPSLARTGRVSGAKVSKSPAPTSSAALSRLEFRRTIALSVFEEWALTIQQHTSKRKLVLGAARHSGTIGQLNGYAGGKSLLIMSF